MGGIPFITVEGPIGVGKTSLAKAISEKFQYALLKEIVDENPFLGKFYENIEEWSFQTEMFFLCNRYKQLVDINNHYLAQKKPVVADYHIFKNLIFAQRTLNQNEYQKYLKIYDILTGDMPKPNVIIYLNASLETLLDRIELRGREIEKNISPLYLEQLSLDYETAMNEFERQHPDIPVIRFNGDQLDFVKNESDLMHIFDTLSTSLKKRSIHL
ncbi:MULTISPECIES: deoxynucleoside kinase [Cytobacillus]|jgi:deoxyguanosine kinase|uniref:Deoxyguanosine kinase n=3 Tax=Cytobacillus TaxID=2675230 RepID=A0A160M5S0_9BACI|nr:MULTISPECIES: deoxynucleoside kinase [Cytobacillus]EFV74036.1 deoxyguanosine kinase [Bacillus sp. 2_A_57_CT2]MBY0160480.1 deoxynucleoside kinase [Cytobacillus firmus]AND37662.1 deoxyguanosine kinase [Cytobacillus oceanisediminis 2691]MBU8733692.1 deoxynucleoside kinase [Cytobacillus oceanisediminis]MCM3246746.1 deoxynucleoside kinase [Cytobacillus oceanisediminis]